MTAKPKLKGPALIDVYRFFLCLGILENILASWYLFSLPSKTQTVFLAGFSLQRVGVGFAIFFVLGIYIFLLVDSCRSRKLLKFITSRLEIILNVDVFHILIRSSLAIVLIASFVCLFFYLFPGSQELIYPRLLFFLPNDYIFADMGSLSAILIGWVFLISLKIFILHSYSGSKASRLVSIPVRLMIISWIIEFSVGLYFGLWSLVTRKVAVEILQEPGLKILILAIWFSLWAFLHQRNGWARRYFLLFTCISIWICVFMVSIQFAQWFDRWYTPANNYFNLLASSFLRGKLYLINPPTTGDIVLFDGQWFVPQPPFPAILMLPFIAILGIKSFNTTTFSLALAATTAVIVFLILHQLIKLGWIKLSHSEAIWLTVLFSFGTMFWWLSIDSRAWFFSQVVTVLCSALTFLSVLKKWSPWVTGVCLAAAILCRPNEFVLWPALLAIAIQLNLNSEGKVNWKRALKWGIFSAIPVIIGVGLLLSYNYLRFGNFLDFEYGNLNGAGQILQDVANYGLFSPHFMPFNLYYMFLAPPPLSAECGFFLTRGWGMSMFATTPAIIYLFRRFKISWWTIGCWCSILLSVIVLSMYSNNGALQYGFRYLLDFIIPVVMLVAYNAGNRISLPIKSLIIASIFINYYGTYSFFRGPC